MTRNRQYGLIVNPNCLDLTLFRQLATAGLTLQKVEPETARLLLFHSLEVAAGDLPDFKPGTQASNEVEELYALRDKAVDAVERLSSKLESRLVEEGSPIESLHGVGLASPLGMLMSWCWST